MAWNEPGGQQKPQNPWGKGKKPSQTDVEKLLNHIKAFYHALIQKKGPKRPSSWQKGRAFFSEYGHYVIPAGLVAIFILSGITVVGSGEQAVVLKLGQYNRVLTTGVHWLPPLVEKSYLVPEAKMTDLTFTGNVATADFSILTFSLNVQYQITQPEAYLFKVADADALLEDGVSIALHQVMGETKTADLLTASKEVLNQRLLVALTNDLDALHSGIHVTDLSLQSLAVPQEVTASQTDALRAKQDALNLLAQAKDSGAELVAEAQANATQILSQAKAYQQQVVLVAQGETARYLALLPEYQYNPEMTRTRLYVQTMTTIFSKVSKVLIDLPQHSMVHFTLPLQGSAASPPQTAPVKTVGGAPAGGKPAGNEETPVNPVPGYGVDTDANSY